MAWFKARSHRKRERGQAMVFVLLFLPVLILSLLFLYKAGIVTSEKMQLQNAADAAAYSTSLIEARDLNYMAYTNRAMVANEVAIGQVVGLASWARHWKSYGDYIRAYDTLVLSPITLGTSTGPINAFTSFTFLVPGGFASTALGTVAKVGAQVLSMINKVYGGSQTGFHIVSVLYAAGTMFDVIEKNAPDAQLSPFGMLGLISHMYTYGAVPGTPGAFIKTYKPNKQTAADLEGMQRFAAITRQARDEFTQKRGWEFELPILDIDESPGLDLGIFEFTLDIKVYVAFEMNRFGGSELRYVGAKSRGDKFNWSAADDTDVGLIFDFDASAKVTVDLGILGSFDINLGGVSLSFGNGKANLDVEVCVPAVDCWDVTIIPDIDFPTSLPFSGAAYQAGKAGSQLTNVFTDPNNFYGDAPQNFIAWKTGYPPLVMGIATLGAGQMYLGTNKATTYKGLAQYNDTIPPDDPWGFQAPYLFIGVIKDFDDTNKTGPRPVGQFEMNYGEDATGPTSNLTDELGAVAKSEVYFSRPNDSFVPYFARQDNLKEYGSAFNPYWQARLAPTTHVERVVSLWLQQGQSFGTVAQTLSLGAWNPLDLIP